MIITVLPGTNIELPRAGYSVRTLLSSLFLAGGLMLSQVSSLTDLPPYALQNWVKRSFVPPPVNKKYSEHQFCRVAIINSLKDSLQIDTIIKLIHYVTDYNSGEATDLIDDTALYCCFAEALVLAENDINKLDEAIATTVADFAEPYPGARERMRAITKAMSIYYISSQIKSSAELLLFNLGVLDS